MTDRKRYSQRREDALYAVVNRALMDFRVAVLRGKLEGVTARYQEDLVYKALHDLGDKVCAEYRRSYAPQREGDSK